MLVTEGRNALLPVEEWGATRGGHHDAGEANGELTRAGGYMSLFGNSCLLVRGDLSFGDVPFEASQASMADRSYLHRV
jgi:hypothetical protein